MWGRNAGNRSSGFPAVGAPWGRPEKSLYAWGDLSFGRSRDFPFWVPVCEILLQLAFLVISKKCLKITFFASFTFKSLGRMVLQMPLFVLWIGTCFHDLRSNTWVTWFLEVSSDHVVFAIYVQILESLGAQDCSFCSLDWKRGKEEGRQGEEEREGKNRGRGGKQGEGEGRGVNLLIHPPTSRSPAPAANTGNSELYYYLHI